jgi:hypothetical protein
MEKLDRIVSTFGAIEKSWGELSVEEREEVKLRVLSFGHPLQLKELLNVLGKPLNQWEIALILLRLIEIERLNETMEYFAMLDWKSFPITAMIAALYLTRWALFRSNPQLFAEIIRLTLKKGALLVTFAVIRLYCNHCRMGMIHLFNWKREFQFLTNTLKVLLRTK